MNLLFVKNGYSTFNCDNKCDFRVIVAPAESENRVGVYSEKCLMQLSSVLALYSDAIIHLFVISIHSIKLMNALNRNMILLPKLHSFIVLI